MLPNIKAVMGILQATYKSATEARTNDLKIKA
jgi:hypothetical protein